MLTLNAAGKSASESVELIREALEGNEDEIKILLDDPSVWTEINKFLNSQGFSDIVPEDDDGALCVILSKNARNNEAEPHEAIQMSRHSISGDVSVQKNTTAIIISGENKKYRSDFLRKFVISLTESRIKPNIIALMNDSVKLAAYDSETCAYLKLLVSEGVDVLVSESCTDRLHLSEAIGTGELADMSELIEKVLECGKVISI